MAFTFSSTRDEYADLWESMSILPDRKSEVMATARRILGNQSRYEDVSAETGVPWFVIGIIHSMECGLSFKQHLHNGDSLARRTVQVPKGRPTTHDGPFTWEESAIDALQYDGLDNVSEWSVERIAFELEKFNGTGYRRKGIHSPYLWSYSNQYERGKYIRDGVWSPTAISQQCGAMPILYALMDIAPEKIALYGPEAPRKTDHDVQQTWPKATVPEPPSKTKVAAKSKTNRWLGGGIGLWLMEKLGFIKEALPSATDQAQEVATPIESLGMLLKTNLSSVIVVVTIAILIIAFLRHTDDKHELETRRMTEE